MFEKLTVSELIMNGRELDRVNWQCVELHCPHVVQIPQSHISLRIYGKI
jgi:hypothetical protein